jgi:hypothetical protein
MNLRWHYIPIPFAARAAPSPVLLAETLAEWHSVDFVAKNSKESTRAKACD